MPVSKLKTLAILILLLANLALLVLVVPARLATARDAATLHDSLCSLYEAQEIPLTPDAIPDTVPLYVLELKETDAGSLQAAKALLGEELLMQDDSSRYLSTYRSGSGTCSISRSGEFSAQLTGQEERGDLKASSRKLLKNMGFSFETLPDAERVRAGVYTVTATQQILGMPVFSGDLVLTWSNSRLTADALIAFLSARYELGWVGSAVTGLQQGYIRSETAAAASVRLTPVWRLETDTGTFQINGMTGEVTAA